MGSSMCDGKSLLIYESSAHRETAHDYWLRGLKKQHLVKLHTTDGKEDMYVVFTSNQFELLCRIFSLA